MFIHESDSWPRFRWDEATIAPLQLRAMHALGYLAGRMAAIGFDTRLAAVVEATTHDIVASSAIEGVSLNADEVRSSVARRLGVQISPSRESSHYVDGIVEMMLDATRRSGYPLTAERLCAWHRLLFPGSRDIIVGAWRREEMSVVSGMFGRERLHYRAPAPERVAAEVAAFLAWMTDSANEPSILTSAIAHLWFVSIHPFDDGNGRIGRAISDMVLASLDADAMHFYSLSSRILKDKSHYYRVLEQTQRGDGDITEWLTWYIGAFMAAVDDSSAMLSGVLRKATFWNTHAEAVITERQRLVLNKYLDGFDAKLTAKHWQKIAGVSKDTALRDIDALVRRGILVATPGRVRDIPYSLVFTPADANALPLSDISIERGDKEAFINATYAGSERVRDRLSRIDLQRLDAGEVTERELVFKYFAYLGE